MGSKASLWEVEPQPSQSMWEVEKTAAAPNSGLPPGQIPLDSYGSATLQGFANIGKGVNDAASGMYNAVRHPIDTAQSMMQAPGRLLDQIKQVPGAIRDINQSPDPTGTYANVAGQTAGEGAGQAVVGAAAPELPGMAKEAALNLPAKGKALAKVGAQEAISHIPGAGRIVRRPSIGDWWDAAKAQAPEAEPTPAAEAAEAPKPRLVDQISERTTAAEPFPTKTAQWPPEAPAPKVSVPQRSGYQSLQDEQSLVDQIRSQVAGEDRMRMQRDPLGTPKGEQIDSFNQAAGKPSPPVKYTKTPGVSLKEKMAATKTPGVNAGPPAATSVPLETGIASPEYGEWVNKVNDIVKRAGIPNTVPSTHRLLEDAFNDHLSAAQTADYLIRNAPRATTDEELMPALQESLKQAMAKKQ